MVTLDFYLINLILDCVSPVRSDPMETTDKQRKNPTEPPKRSNSGVFIIGTRCMNCGNQIMRQHETSDHVKGLCFQCSDQLNANQSL